jgi:membrane-associated protease RseP (regulator of RpoE activity)
MEDQKSAKYKTAFIVAAALIALLGILGIFDLRHAPYEGFGADPNNTVTKVFPDSPAQQAGFQAGDRLISSGGIDMKDNLTLVRRPRAKIGETRTYVVERSGESVNLELTWLRLWLEALFTHLKSVRMKICAKKSLCLLPPILLHAAITWAQWLPQTVTGINPICG